MTQSEINQRIALEEELVAFLLKTARAAEFRPYKVWDGEEFVQSTEDSELMEAVFSVDESEIWFKRHPDEKAHIVWIVLGNDGYDAIADCTMGPEWDDVIKTVSDRFEPKE